MPTVHILVKGKVQGVFYRASAKTIAEHLSITGWIRNINGTDVEALVTGSLGRLQDYIQWCNQGPSHARVTEVIVTPHEETIFHDFKIVR